MAQNGNILGKINDAKTGEELIGVTVTIEGTNLGTTSDYEGNFKLQNIKPGTYNVVFSYVSYAKKTLQGIVIAAGKTETINVGLKATQKELNEVVVQAELKRESAATLLVQQKNASSISDGLSTEVIRKTPDRNTGDVLKRVSGATIQDNKYAVIRGLPDRYNAAFINGSPLPSSEPDRRAFAFDIFPANLIDNLVIIKSATPDLSAEFAGGIIQVKTKDIPEKDFYQLSIGSSFNTLTTFKPFMKNVSGGTDLLGIDDGTRSLPNAFPDNKTMTDYQKNIQNMADVKRLVGVAHLLPNNFAIQQVKGMLGSSVQFSMGQTKKLSKLEMGSVFALTSQVTPNNQEIVRKDYDNNGTLYEYIDQQSTTNTLNGLLWNFSLKGKMNKISFKNILNVNTNDQTTVRSGKDLMNGFDQISYAMWYTQNILNSHQINAEHVLRNQKTKLNWSVAYNKLNRIVPDFRRIKYQRAFITDPSIPEQYNYSVPVQATAQPDVAGRFYSTQNDNSYSGNFDLSSPVKTGSIKHEIKTGVYFQLRDRNFDARQLGYSLSPAVQSVFTNTYLSMPVNEIFAPSHIDTNGFVLKEVTTPTDAYTASSNLFAGYFRIDSKIGARFKLIYGVRLESYNQKLSTYRTGINEKFEIDTLVTDILPSLNAVYELTDKINLRASYSQTVSRPEFRELASFQFYDFNDLLLVEGNSNLQRTKIANYDFRVEWYPSAGQVVSMSLFYKEFNNPIEKILFSGGSPRIMTYQNVPKAENYGVEVDYKLNLGRLLNTKEGHFLSEFNLLGNFAYIQSKVDLSTVIAKETNERPLQGQSPYIVNTGIQYSHPKQAWGASFMLNRIGERITNAGNSEYASYWEKPRTIIDLQFNKTFFKNLDLRVGVRDLLAQNIVFYQNKDNNQSFDASKDAVIWSYKVGTSYSLSVTYKF